MNIEQLNELVQLLGEEKVITSASDLSSYRFDYWCVKHYRDWQGQHIDSPACVVRPHRTEDVQATMRFAYCNGLPVVPFGLGSGVCGGIEPSPSQILLDMGAMNAIGHIDDVDLLATFEAGVNGLVAEEAVAKHGLTIGHWPQSVAISSVGGWVSTRASGQFSTAYGNIEDIIYAMEVVLPNGELLQLGKAPRAAAGPDLRHLFMGAEGTMGVVTKVTFSLRRQAAHREVSAYYAADMAEGFKIQRLIIQSEWRPPVMRLYDASEVARLFPAFVSGTCCVLLMVHEGPVSRVKAELSDIKDLCDEQGLVAADNAIVYQWMEHRNNVPKWKDLLAQGLIADTVEVSATWQQIDALYDGVIAALNTVPSIVNASGHSSHVYRSGINLYFTFVCQPENAADMEDLYFECWDKALSATASFGGGVAHHHGVGRLRKNYIHHDLGENGVELLRLLKQSIDQKGIMNPGNLIK